MPDVLTAQLYVSIDGSDAPTKLMEALRRIEVDASLHMPAMATIELHDDKLEWVDDASLDIGKKLEIFGMANSQGGELQPQKKLMFSGFISSFEPEYSGEGTGQYAVMVVRAYDALHKTHRGTGTKTFVDQTDSDIARSVIGEAGLSANVTSTNVQNQHFFRGDLTAYETLTSLARRNGHIVVVDGNTVHWKPPSDLNFETVSLQFGKGLLDFRPVLTTTGQINSVVVQGWDRKKKEEVTGTAGSAAFAPTATGLGKRGSAFAQAANGAAKLHLSEALPTQSAVQSMAKALMDTISAHDVTAEGKCLGDPRLRPGGKVAVSATGRRFNGTYLVTRVRHTYDVQKAFHTQFWLGGMSSGTFGALVGGPQEHERRLSAGLIVGIVTNVNDPEKLGRVKVKFPTIAADQESWWAPVILPGAGKDRGFMVLPEVNDEVMVAFASGDFNQPFVLGGVWNGKDAPPNNNAVANGAIDVREFKSRAGHLFRFVDDTGGGKIELIDKTGSNKLIIESQMGKISIEATGDISIKGTQSVKVEGMQISVEAKGKLELKAPMVEIAGSGMVKISGPMVQIN